MKQIIQESAEHLNVSQLYKLEIAAPKFSIRKL